MMVLSPCTKGWFSEHSSLKPFTYPVPETRFFHAGANVYKFKIKYGNSMSVNIDFHGSIVNEELQDAIRVILGNLNDLCPFTTEHLIIFPYLNQWEKVSDLRFMRGDTFIVPYPYVCTVYVELNLLKHGALWGKAGCREACNSDNSGSDQKDNVDTERTIKWRRLEDTVEISHPRISRGRNVTKNTTCIHATAKPEVGFENEKLWEDTVHPTLNQPEEIACQYCGSATVNNDYENKRLWESAAYVRTKNTENAPQKGQVAAVQKRAEENVELKAKGFLELLKSFLFPPILQRIFTGSSQPS
ncbi:membrane-anchored junction protein isoform X11 [Podarcis lilfordi]|uniref:Membrane-anchored junction protein isoform X11 n=1 Tax=Podarcis lilfordi TaxID=74358 RepID=A0AA35KN19_9SAUR|nr:membrane-anchored junction protein isoform X11 [Podarcis lilfordi]